jgi:hypothetical protein
MLSIQNTYYLSSIFYIIYHPLLIIVRGFRLLIEATTGWFQWDRTSVFCFSKIKHSGYICQAVLLHVSTSLLKSESKSECMLSKIIPWLFSRHRRPRQVTRLISLPPESKNFANLNTIYVHVEAGENDPSVS